MKAEARAVVADQVAHQHVGYRDRAEAAATWSAL